MEVTEKEIQSFQEVIRDYSEYDFTDYSLNSLRRRLTRILLEYDIEIDQIISRMRSDPVYMEKIVRKLTVHTTELFRDPPIWKTIRSDLLPTWGDKSSIHIWHPGCSTGQEIYSMMMLLDEVGMLEKTQLYGTDLNPDVIESAKKGKYKYHFNQHYLENFDKVMLSGSGSSTQTGTSNRNHHKPWKRYFTVNEARDSIRMSDHLRSKPVYKKLDLVKDSNPFHVKFDLIVCRNVIIYFNSGLQNRVFDLFYQNLTHNGALLLGVHESIMGPFARKFEKRGDIYFPRK